MYSDVRAPDFRGGAPNTEGLLSTNVVDGRLGWVNFWGKSVFLFVFFIRIFRFDSIHYLRLNGL